MNTLSTCPTCSDPDVSKMWDNDTAHQELNVPLLMGTLQAIENHPESWNQASYFNLPRGKGADTKIDLAECGTTMCFAGWSTFLTWGDQAWIQVRATHNGTEATARDLLGITELEAAHLFLHTETNLEDIRACVAEILSRRGLDASLPDPAQAPAFEFASPSVTEGVPA